MGNEISKDTLVAYEQYVKKCNDILMDMSAQMKATTRIRNMKRPLSIAQQNSQMLYGVADLVHFLYGPNTPPPFQPPPNVTDPAQHLQYENTLVSHLRMVLFNDARVLTFNVSNIEKIMFINLLTYLELAKTVKSIVKKYSALEFNNVDDTKAFVFDLEYVDFRTTVEIEDFIASPVVLSRNSASASIVYRGSWKQSGIFIKTFARDDEMLLFEKEIYRYVKHQIDNAPMPYKETYRKHFIVPVFSCVYGRKGRVAIATEDTGGISGDTLMKSMSISTTEYLAILFQVLYIVVLMQRIGISHNDIHLGNVIVTPRTGNKFDRFRNDNLQTFDIAPHGTMFNVKIYDFDRASSIIGRNTALDKTGACKKVGQCNRMDSQKDVFNVLMLIHVAPTDTVMAYFRDMFWDEMLMVNRSAAMGLRSVVARNTKPTSFWQSFCFENCEHSNSPLLETSVFLNVFCNAMKKLQ